MNEQRKWTIVLMTIAIFVTTAAFLPGLGRAGDLEPPTPPGEPTMHTLDEIYQKLEQLAPGAPLPVAKTGQTTSYDVGDDGDLEKGVAWPIPRFTVHVDDETVTDNLTGLMWTKDANIGPGERTWVTALSGCANCTAGGYSDWHLPNVMELQSLIDYGQYNPALPAGHPFTNVQSANYWSSSTVANVTSYAWSVLLYSGYVLDGDKNNSGYYVWCVRGGQ